MAASLPLSAGLFLPVFSPPKGVAELLGSIAFAEARGILGEGPLLAVEQAVVLRPNATRSLRRLGRSHLSRYMRLPNYRSNSRLRQGFTEEDLSDGGSEWLVEGLVAWGSVGDIRERVREHLSAGADQLCVQVVTDDPIGSLSERWRSLAPALL